jgi:hypothetical protein
VFFDGKPVLPKAATPMTAALTVLAYGETFSATAHYFTPDDLAVIRNGYKSYEDRLERLIEVKEKEIEERLKRRGEPIDRIKINENAQAKAINELKDTREGSCHDQYGRMLKTGENPEIMCANEAQRIEAENEDNLMKKLNEYVGAEGKFMPFTNYVEILLPYESLRDIRVVDTPGINDPVRSREERTMEYLRECDAAFVISPAGQFLAAETTELMDRISGKEGISELFLIASKADNELYASEFEKAGGKFERMRDKDGNFAQDEKGNPVVFVKKTANLNMAKESIQESCFQILSDRLKQVSKNNPETEHQFHQLIIDGKDRLIIASGICSAMSASFYKRVLWDDEMKHTWESLTRHYTDYFSEGESGKANLEGLGNIEKIREKIELTRSKKNEIMAKKQEDYLNQQKVNIDNYLMEVLKAGKAKYNTIQNTGIQQLEAEKKSLEKKFYSGADQIDDAFDSCFEDFKQAAISASTQGVGGMIKSTGSEVDSMKESETETRTVDKPGIIAKFFRWLGIGGIRTESWNIDTIRTGAAQSVIAALVNDLQKKLEESLENAKAQWRKDLPRRVVDAYSKVFENDTADDTDKLRRALRNVLNKMDIPVFDFSGLAFRGGGSGTLRGADAVQGFRDSISEYLTNLDLKYRQRTKGVLETIEKQIKEERISDLLFKDIEKQINELEDNIKNKTYVMERLKNCINELEIA